MSDETPPPPPERHAGLFFGQPMWVKVLVGVSAVLMGIGGTMHVVNGDLWAGDQPGANEPAKVASSDVEPAPPGTTTQSFTPNSFTGGGTTFPTTRDPDPSTTPGSSPPADVAQDPTQSEAFEVWAPVVFSLGMSFFIAFAVGYALRTMIKAALLGFGFLFGGIFVLQYIGFIQVDWSRVEEYNYVLTNLQEQFASLKTFITGALPSAAAATGGLVTGFRTK